MRYAGVGALLGYGLKYAVPLSKFEKSNVFTDEYIKEAKSVALEAKERAFDNILDGFKNNNAPSTEVQDIFIRNKDHILDDTFKTDTLGKGAKEAIEGYRKTIVQASKNAEKEFELNRTLLAKGDRFTYYFIAMGAAILAGVSIFMNFMDSDKKETDKKS